MISFINDHKTGFVLSTKIAAYLNQKAYSNIYGEAVRINLRTYFRFCWLFSFENKYVVFIRHPYEIITSGYNYHKVCQEDWATKIGVGFYDWWHQNPNKYFGTDGDLSYRPPELIHSPVLSRDGKSYQEILNSIPIEEGLKYELDNVGKLTIMGMYKYPWYNKANVLTVRMEDFTLDFSKTIHSIISFLNISHSPDHEAIKGLESLNLKKQSISDRLSDDHVTNKSQDGFMYKKMWSPELYEYAKRHFPEDLLSKFGYTA